MPTGVGSPRIRRAFCAAPLLVVCALLLGSGGPASATSGRTTRSDVLTNRAEQAFGRWLAQHHPGFEGPSVCPSSHSAQQHNGGILCLAEIHDGERYVQVWAKASLGATVVFRHISTGAWKRRWSRYSRTRPKIYSPGLVSVNGWGADWRWLVLGADALCRQKRRTQCTALGLDGDWKGYDLFFTFRCRTHGTLIPCRNKLGDALRWLPNAH